MKATLSTLDNSIPDPVASRQLHLVARQAGRGVHSVTAQPLPPLSRLQRLVSWLGVLVCSCPACRRSLGKQPDTAWHYSHL